ncbi:hypothetical protein K7X08_023823 [Anisodus acutangulus]|uniref:Uncharacterized protein n=1 Tax=Anisodus acutangulus TaxID=402998 RepID=A0A9Q1L7X3_9SOLA|nr:hypothetical protein K7X08_023823 [Anisodus acutangulus]
MDSSSQSWANKVEVDEVEEGEIMQNMMLQTGVMNDDIFLSKNGEDKESTRLIDAYSRKPAEEKHPSDILQKAIKVANDLETFIEEQSKEDLHKINELASDVLQSASSKHIEVANESLVIGDRKEEICSSNDSVEVVPIAITVNDRKTDGLASAEVTEGHGIDQESLQMDFSLNIEVVQNAHDSPKKAAKVIVKYSPIIQTAQMETINTDGAIIEVPFFFNQHVSVVRELSPNKVLRDLVSPNIKSNEVDVIERDLHIEDKQVKRMCISRLVSPKNISNNKSHKKGNKNVFNDKQFPTRVLSKRTATKSNVK